MHFCWKVRTNCCWRWEDMLQDTHWSGEVCKQVSLSMCLWAFHLPWEPCTQPEAGLRWDGQLALFHHSNNWSLKHGLSPALNYIKACDSRYHLYKVNCLVSPDTLLESPWPCVSFSSLNTLTECACAISRHRSKMQGMCCLIFEGVCKLQKGLEQALIQAKVWICFQHW